MRRLRVRKEQLISCMPLLFSDVEHRMYVEAVEDINEELDKLQKQYMKRQCNEKVRCSFNKNPTIREMGD